MRLYFTTDELSRLEVFVDGRPFLLPTHSNAAARAPSVNSWPDSEQNLMSGEGEEDSDDQSATNIRIPYRHPYSRRALRSSIPPVAKEFRIRHEGQDDVIITLRGRYTLGTTRPYGAWRGERRLSSGRIVDYTFNFNIEQNLGISSDLTLTFPTLNKTYTYVGIVKLQGAHEIVLRGAFTTPDSRKVDEDLRADVYEAVNAI